MNICFVDGEILKYMSLQTAQLWTKNSSSFGSSGTKYGSAGNRAHSRPKSMLTFAFQITWLKCSFHNE